MKFNLLLFCILSLCFSACAGKRNANTSQDSALDAFMDQQKTKISKSTVFRQAEFDFWAALYEPTTEDIESMRRAWVTHGDAFPVSEAIMTIEGELFKPNQSVVLVSLFMSDWDQADLKSKLNGWAVAPVPQRITELSEKDAVLRVLMPVRNQWARYFLLQYDPGVWSAASELVVSDRTSRIALLRHL